MPVPKLKGNLSQAEIAKAYEEFGWKKIIVFDWIEVDQRTGGFSKKTYEVNSDAMPCTHGDDATYQLSFVQLVPTGLVWTCANCRRTEGPLSFEASGIRLVDQKPVNLVEAWATISKTNQKRPIGMPVLSGTGGFTVKR